MFQGKINRLFNKAEINLDNLMAASFGVSGRKKQYEQNLFKSEKGRGSFPLLFLVGMFLIVGMINPSFLSPSNLIYLL